MRKQYNWEMLKLILFIFAKNAEGYLLWEDEAHFLILWCDKVLR